MESKPVKSLINYRLLQDCIHCGLCLPKCPSYAVMGTEMDSPRGRIFLTKLVADGRQDVGDAFKKHFDLCLACRCCETACPSGVQYHEIFDTAQKLIQKDMPTPLFTRIAQNIILNHIYPHPGRLDFIFSLLKFYQRSGLQKLIRVTRILRLFSKKIALTESFMPDILGFRKLSESDNGMIDKKTGNKKVGFLRGCVMDYIEPESNRNTVQIINTCGYHVVIPEEIHCCGAVHMHNGKTDVASQFAKGVIDAFERAQVDTILVNAAGCGAMMKEYAALLANDPEYSGKSAAFSKKVLDISEFLDAESKKLTFHPVQKTLVYDDPCHLLHGQKISKQPQNILSAIPGIQLKPLHESAMCCGSAGTFNITQPELSLKVLQRKMKNIAKSGADTVVTANIGCMIQLKRGSELLDKKIDVKHIVDIIHESLSQDTNRK